MRSTRVFVCLVVVTAFFTFTTRASHADDTASAAKKHFEEGTTLFNLGDFAKAAEEYKAAYHIAHDPVILYNIAQSYRLGNDFAQALFFYRSFLRNLPNASNREEVEARIHKLEQQIAQQKTVASTPPNEPLPSTAGAPQPVNEPRTSEPSTATAPAATAKDATSPALSPEPRSTELTASPPPRRTPTYKKWWVWTVVGVVAAGAAVGIGLGVGLSGGSDTHFGTTRVSF